MTNLCACGCGQTCTKTYKRGHVQKARAIDPMRSFVVNESTGCWEWSGAKTNGYGRMAHRLAYRVIYEQVVGAVPEVLELDHVCRNRGCVNPAHLEPVTRATNVRRGDVAVLDECAVYEIRDLLAQGWTRTRIAKTFNVTAGTISHIATGRSWSGVAL